MTGPLCQTLEWDSRFFGVPIARALGSHVDAPACAAMIDWCESHRIECLYFLCPADDAPTVHVLESAGFHLMDVRITLERTVGPAPVTGGTRPARASDVAALRTIALTAHRDTRFHADTRFPPDRCDELYATWIEKSCAGYADCVIVAERRGAPVGYISLHLDAPGARIGLIGVEASWRRHGIGRDLLGAALAWLAARQVTRLSVVTPGRNVAAQALYQATGFHTADVGLWYHRWFDR